MHSSLRVSRWICSLALAASLLGAGAPGANAQAIDCQRLRAQIAQIDRGGGGQRGGGRRIANELARTQAAIQQLGCGRGGFSFFGGGGDNPQCPGLMARAQQLQASIGQAQGGGDPGMRGDLVARFNAYCREGAQPPRERGFFESLFGGGEPARQPPLPDLPPGEGAQDEGDVRARGGSQAVCVRTCDGGFFPLGLSSRHPSDSLNEMCAALCPGTEAAVYTRSPDADIKTAVSLEGKPYMDMPNALKFQKNYSQACSCRSAGKSWAETLANAEQVLGNQRKGDILVTQEKSDELSRPKLDPKARAALLKAPGTAKVSPEDAAKLAADPPALRDTSEETDADGVKRLIRRVGPQN